MMREMEWPWLGVGLMDFLVIGLGCQMRWGNEIVDDYNGRRVWERRGERRCERLGGVGMSQANKCVIERSG